MLSKNDKGNPPLNRKIKEDLGQKNDSGKTLRRKNNNIDDINDNENTKKRKSKFSTQIPKKIKRTK